MSCEKSLRRQLQANGLRFTTQRETILTVLHLLEAPATAEEVFELVQMQNENVDLSTIYRTLELFQKLQIVSQYDPGDGKRRYEHVGIEHPHHHLVCRECGGVISLSAEVVMPLLQQISTLYDFQIDMDGITVTGLCAVCRSVGSTDFHQTETTSSIPDHHV